MHYRIIIFLILILILRLSAEEFPLNTLSVEKETAGHIQNGNWDGVINAGKEALKQGVDFYNLRYRMGIAYYQKKNYHGAIQHFFKAYQINDSDPLLNEYLYWAYNYSGNVSEARNFASNLSSDLKKRAGIPETLTGDYLNVTFNYGFPSDKNFADSYIGLTDLTVNGSQFLSKNLLYTDIGINKILTSRISVYAAYARLNKTSWLYAQEDGYAITKPTYKTQLNQLYLSGKTHVMRGTDISSGLHFVNINYKKDRYVTNGVTGRIVTDNISKNEGLAFISLLHRFPYLTTSVTALMSNFNNKEQIQGDFYCFLYPLGNLNFYSGLTLTYHHQKPNDNNMITEYLMGGKVFEKLWAELYLTDGILQNASRYQGYIIYNGMDAVISRMGGRFIIMYSQELSIILNYVYQNHESHFNPEDSALSPVNLFKYSTHSITGVLRWNF